MIPGDFRPEIPPPAGPHAGECQCAHCTMKSALEQAVQDYEELNLSLEHICSFMGGAHFGARRAATFANAMLQSMFTEKEFRELREAAMKEVDAAKDAKRDPRLSDDMKVVAFCDMILKFEDETEWQLKDLATLISSPGTQGVEP